MSGFNFQVMLPGEGSPKPAAAAKKWNKVITQANLNQEKYAVRRALQNAAERNVGVRQRKSRKAERKSRKAERKSRNTRRNNMMGGRRAERKSRKAERKSRKAERKSRRAGRR